MSQDQWAALLGTLAACCTTVAFVPQLVRIHRRGGDDVSYGMLVLFLAGVLLWLGYGLLIHAWPVILANSVTTVLVLACIVLKHLRARAARAQRPRVEVAR